MVARGSVQIVKKGVIESPFAMEAPARRESRHASISHSAKQHALKIR
jgi:hypothetical protein